MNTTKIVFLTAAACSMMILGCGQQRSAPRNGQMPGDTTGRDTMMQQQDTMKNGNGNGSDTARQMPRGNQKRGR